MPYCGRQPLAYLRREVPDGREPLGSRPGSALGRGPCGLRGLQPATLAVQASSFLLCCWWLAKSQSSAHRLDCAAAMGDLVLFLAGHLGVGAVARVGVGDEDGVVAEAGGAAGFGGEDAVDGAGE